MSNRDGRKAKKETKRKVSHANKICPRCQSSLDKCGANMITKDMVIIESVKHAIALLIMIGKVITFKTHMCSRKIY